MFSEHNGIKLEISNTWKVENFTNMWKLNNMFLNHWWIKEEIKRKIRQHFEMNETKTHHIRIYGLQLKPCLDGNLKLEKSIFIYF